RGLERINVVDPFSDIAAFVEQVLIDVRDGCRVGIDADMSREDLGKGCASGADDVDTNARLQDAIPLGDAIQAVIESRTIQRVRQRPDQPSSGFEGKLRV